jgi:hypothetical protein
MRGLTLAEHAELRRHDWACSDTRSGGGGRGGSYNPSEKRLIAAMCRRGLLLKTNCACGTRHYYTTATGLEAVRIHELIQAIEGTAPRAT